MSKSAKKVVFTVLPLFIAATLLLSACATMGRLFGKVIGIPDGVFVKSADSINGHYTVNIYLVQDEDTGEFCIRGELVDNDSKDKDNKDTKNIYWSHNESEAEVVWKSDSVVTINGRELHVARNQTYDWRIDD